MQREETHTIFWYYASEIRDLNGIDALLSDLKYANNRVKTYMKSVLDMWSKGLQHYKVMHDFW